MFCRVVIETNAYNMVSVIVLAISALSGSWFSTVRCIILTGKDGWNKACVITLCCVYATLLFSFAGPFQGLVSRAAASSLRTLETLSPICSCRLPVSVGGTPPRLAPPSTPGAVRLICNPTTPRGPWSLAIDPGQDTDLTNSLYAYERDVHIIEFAFLKNMHTF